MLLLKYLPEIAAFVLFLAFSTQAIDGTILILIEFGLVGMLVITQPRKFVETITRWWPLLLTPVLAIVSALWSSVPDLSARYGAQLLFTVFVGVFIARLLTPQRCLFVFLASTLVFCLLSIASGRQGPSDVGSVLVGLTGSKNSMSYEGQLLFDAAVAVLLMRDTPRLMRLVALASLPVGALILFVTNSATGALLAAAGAGILLTLWFAERLTPGGRLVTVVLGVLVLMPLLMLAPEISAFWDHFLYDTLNKDPTLTGRTFLWERADDLIAHKPLLGYGYQAIWMGDSTDTIALERLTGITDGRTFHFHNTFRQVAVDTGLLGLAIFAATLLFALFKGIAQALLRPSLATSFFFTMFLLAVSRAFTDTVLQPFLIHTVLLYTCCVYASWQPETARQGNTRRAYVPPLGLGRPA